MSTRSPTEDNRIFRESSLPSLYLLVSAAVPPPAARRGLLLLPATPDGTRFIVPPEESKDGRIPIVTPFFATRGRAVVAGRKPNIEDGGRRRSKETEDGREGRCHGRGCGCCRAAGENCRARI